MTPWKDRERYESIVLYMFCSIIMLPAFAFIIKNKNIFSILFSLIK